MATKFEKLQNDLKALEVKALDILGQVNTEDQAVNVKRAGLGAAVLDGKSVEDAASDLTHAEARLQAAKAAHQTIISRVAAKRQEIFQEETEQARLEIAKQEEVGWKEAEEILLALAALRKRSKALIEDTNTGFNLASRHKLPHNRMGEMIGTLQLLDRFSSDIIAGIAGQARLMHVGHDETTPMAKLAKKLQG